MAEGLRATYELGRELAVRTATPGGDEPHAPLVGFRCRPGERAYLHPVHGPAGGPVLTQDRPTDHPWQHGVFTGLHAVNGLDFWHEHRYAPEKSGRIRLERITDLQGDATTVSWRAISRWANAATGQALLQETQAWTVRHGDSQRYLVDLIWTLRGLRPVTFGEYGYGGLAVRPVYHADHETLNANGDRGPATAEQRAGWVDVSAPFDGSREWTGEDITAGAWYGMALFDHPQNPAYPSPWRVDRHGLINPCPSMASDWSIGEGEEISFVHRLVVHRGKGDPDELDRLHEEFAEEAFLTVEY